MEITPIQQDQSQKWEIKITEEERVKLASEWDSISKSEFPLAAELLDTLSSIQRGRNKFDVSL